MVPRNVYATTANASSFPLLSWRPEFSGAIMPTALENWAQQGGDKAQKFQVEGGVFAAARRFSVPQVALDRRQAMV